MVGEVRVLVGGRADRLDPPGQGGGAVVAQHRRLVVARRIAAVPRVADRQARRLLRLLHIDVGTMLQQPHTTFVLKTINI